MIYRERPPSPLVFHSDHIMHERGLLEAHFKRPPSDRKQNKFGIRYQADADLKQHVRSLFGQKCAYCEQFAPRGAIDRFRPTQHAMNLDGTISRDHYWWLHFDWSNLYWCCSECNLIKKNLFPVRASRATQESAKEQSLLLDPCHDKPEHHLTFKSDGRVTPLSRRGEVTIQVLQLNRAGLVAKRRSVASVMEDNVDSLRGFLAEKAAGYEVEESLKQLETELLDAFWPGNPDPFLMLRQQCLWTLLDSWSELPPGLVYRQQWQTLHHARREQPAQVAPRSETRPAIIHCEIRRVHIRNFRSIRDLQLAFQSNGDVAPWLMLLGENGVGKSSVLWAIALALMGPTRAKLSVTAKSVLRRGADSGFVKIEFTDDAPAVMITFSKDSVDFDGTTPDQPFLLLGYGPTRLLPDRVAPVAGTGPLRVKNLFNPTFPLVNAEAWLGQITDDTFDYVAMALKELLNMHEDHVISRSADSGQTGVRLDGATLEELSDGYKSVIAIAIDILRVVIKYFGMAEYGTGIVLLDELDAHLHPRWKMRIVDRFRKVFPRLQFVVTSHDPLCLRGTKHREVVVMRRGSDRNVYASTELPDPGALRVDQLLTSQYFGLNSTVDPDLEQLFEEYYGLLSTDEKRRTTEEVNRLHFLEGNLNGLKLLGETRREQMMYRAIDEFLAQEQKLSDGAAAKSVEKQTWERLARIWNAVGKAEL